MAVLRACWRVAAGAALVGLGVATAAAGAAALPPALPALRRAGEELARWTGGW
jgi:hypothetical protein